MVLEKSEVFQTPVLQVRIRTIKDEKLWFAYRFRLNDQSKELERVIEHLDEYKDGRRLGVLGWRWWWNIMSMLVA